MIVNLFTSIILILIAGCSSAPRPPQVSLSGHVDPVNFHITTHRHTVIKSQLTQGSWRKTFVREMDNASPPLEFFYAIAHSDKIIARIKSPFIDYVYKRLQADLRRYGMVTPLELFVVEDEQKQPQVVLECVRDARAQ